MLDIKFSYLLKVFFEQSRKVERSISHLFPYDRFCYLMVADEWDKFHHVRERTSINKHNICQIEKGVFLEKQEIWSKAKSKGE